MYAVELFILDQTQKWGYDFSASQTLNISTPDFHPEPLVSISAGTS